MEGPLQVKDSTSAVAEPIKSEGVIQSADSSERREGVASPPPNCSICLGKLINTSFTDSCLHQFCFTCLLQWSKIKTECPLCKQTFKSIIHNVRSEEDYDQYHVPRELASQIPEAPIMAIQHLDVNFEVDGNWDVGLRRFFYRTTMTDNRRRAAAPNVDQNIREQLPVVQPQVPRDERRYRRLNPTDYRRSIYTHGIWATSLPDVSGRFRECSAKYFRRHPRELDRLVPWLNRELQILNNRPTDIAYALGTIMRALKLYDIRSHQFRNMVEPYCGVHTEHFIHELLNFARTNLDVAGYDQAVAYLFQAGLSREYVPYVVSPVSSSSSTSSDDSDVRVLDKAIDLRVNAELPSIGPHPVNMPGPSTVGQAFQLELPYHIPDVFTISSESSDNECEVICYVKPRHERTPEIIELDSSDPEDTNMPYTSNDNAECVRTSSVYEDAPQASTSFNSKKGSFNKVHSDILRTNLSETSSSSNDNSSDSDYNPRRSRLCQGHVKKSSKNKINNKKRKRSNVKSRKRVDRSVSSSGESDFRNKSSRRSSQRGKAKIRSSSESSLEEDKKKKLNDAKLKKETNPIRGTVHVRRDLIKKEDRCNQENTVLDNDNVINANSSNGSGSDSSSSSSSSSSTSNSSSSSSASSSSDRKRDTQQRSRTKKCPTSSRVYDVDRNERASKNKVKAWLSTSTISMDYSSRKCYKYKDNKRSRSRSSSESSRMQQKGKRSSYRKRQTRKRRSEHESKKGNNLIDTVLSKREDSVRSSNKSSNYSDRSYKHKRRSRHRDPCKDKKRKQSRSRSRSRSRSGSDSISRSRSRNRFHSKSSNSSVTPSVMSTSLTNKTCSIAKHSDTMNKYKSRSKSRSKKKKRRVRLSYSSNNTE